MTTENTEENTPTIPEEVLNSLNVDSQWFKVNVNEVDWDKVAVLKSLNKNPDSEV